MKLTTVLAALATASALVLVPSAADAGSRSSTDVSGDVEKVSFSGTSSESTTDPARAIGDIVGIRTSLLARSVRVKVRFRDLSRVGNYGHVAIINSPTGARAVSLDVNRRNWQGKIEVTDRNDKKVSCNVSRKIDYVNNTVFISVPRSCLKNPKSVRVGFLTFTGSANSLWVDMAHKTGGSMGRIAYGPRVYL